ncbi:ATP-dependent DNA helicase RecG [mine drainage metagenome]|uniref:ATP-dependent DNA helicase RecG n=1 Tax=mine drainage metagenome TaxID=410659 RepID=A0A1J5SC24_9ZZZZ
MSSEETPGPGSVSKPLAARLAKLALFSDADLVLHLPLRYEDETRITAIAEAPPGVPVQLEVEVASCEVAYRPRRQLQCRVRDGSGMLLVRLLNFYPSQQKQYAPGARLRLFGELREGYFGPEMVHPRARAVAAGETLATALTPVYPTTAGLTQASLRRLILQALDRADLTDTLPDELRRRYALAPFAAAVRSLHQPPASLTAAALASANSENWRRIRFDELLAQQLSLRRAHAARRARGAPVLKSGGELVSRLLASLPFRLTSAQRRCWEEIRSDLGEPHPMQRLLQGDVGSGKTVVAALALLTAVENGWQGALMAPTEILAEQHWRKLTHWLAPLGVEVAWLSGSLKKSQKLAMQSAVRQGSARVVVGTHALIEAGVDFPRLGLAVVDEQHRFGVHQRLALRHKGVSPHQLMMTATPIPRTLAMSYYADLDVSVVDELPPGRTPVLTKLVAEGRRDEVVARVRAACAAGHQAYWVCPLIEESETLQLKTALETHERLRQELPELSIGLIHGRLRAAEKSAVMAAFVAGEIQLLVSTTVIEVGVDVPRASLMVIEHAERFGLAQLHQLRGRVGRGAAESACILLYAQPLSQAGRERLKIIYENADGFEIARADLSLRGPGEFIGARQSGVPLLRYADLEDEALVAQARAAAEELLREQPQAGAAHLARWLAGREELLKA